MIGFDLDEGPERWCPDCRLYPEDCTCPEDQDDDEDWQP